MTDLLHFSLLLSIIVWISVFLLGIRDGVTQDRGDRSSSEPPVMGPQSRIAKPTFLSDRITELLLGVIAVYLLWPLFFAHWLTSYRRRK
jgi:hypothetical protein